MRIYTRTGDEGMTSVIGGGRVSKDDGRVEAYGTIDELNACIGLAAAWMAEMASTAGALHPAASREERSAASERGAGESGSTASPTANSTADSTGDSLADPDTRTASSWRQLADRLTIIQHELFDCGSDLSYARPTPNQLKVNGDMTARLESWIDELEAANPPLERFILPGGSEPSARLHVCRTVCRRAERRIVTLAASQAPCPPEVGRYLNRLSDFLFAAARTANRLAGVSDVEYERGAAVFRRAAPKAES